MTRKTPTRRASKPAPTEVQLQADYFDLQAELLTVEQALADVRNRCADLIEVNRDQCVRLARQDMEINALRAKLAAATAPVPDAKGSDAAKVAP